MLQQPSPQGIASLYMGNPGALQQKVQKEQQAKPGLPPDLKNLMALNIVTNEQDAAKRQQAMSALNSMAPAGQQPPTVAQSIQEQAKQKVQAQMLQQQRQQQGLMALAKQQPSPEVPENTPQPEQQPQGIDQLPAEFGMAGGGIVAFAKGDTVESILRKAPHERTAEDNAVLQEAGYTVQRRELPADSGINRVNTWLSGIGPAVREYFTQGANKLSDEELAKRPNAGGVLNERILRGMGIAPSTAPAPAPAAPAAQEVVQTGSPPIPSSQAAPQQTPPPAPRQMPPTAATRAPVAAAPQGAAPADQQGLGALLEQGIRADLGRDRDVEAQKMLEKQRGIMGMDQYQKSIADVLAGKEAAFKKAQEERTPAWATGLAALGGAPVRGGLGMMLGQAGSAAAKQRASYGDEDLKMQQLLDTLKVDAAKAQLEGNTALAKTYADAYKEVDAARRAALQSGTSLESTRESARSREQIAADNRAARAQAAQGATEQRNMANATQAISRDEVINALQEELKNALKVPTQANQARISMLRQQIEERQNAIYRRFGVPMVEDKMDAAPGASSPGGTMSGWGKAQVVK